MNSVTFELEDLYEENTMAEQSLCDGIDLKWMYEGNSDEEDDTDRWVDMWQIYFKTCSSIETGGF